MSQPRALFLTECLESITDYNYRSIEIILVDDGDTDGSRHIKEMGLVIYATLFMLIGVFISMIISPSDFLKLLIEVPFGIGIYLLLSYKMKIEEVEEFVKIVQPVINREVRAIKVGKSVRLPL